MTGACTNRYTSKEVEVTLLIVIIYMQYNKGSFLLYLVFQKVSSQAHTVHASNEVLHYLNLRLSLLLYNATKRTLPPPFPFWYIPPSTFQERLQRLCTPA